MSATETEVLGYEIVDHNAVPDLYVTYIVDQWQGNRDDPVTSVSRYIGVWRADDLETEERGAFDPDFSDINWLRRSYRLPPPEPLHWHILEEVKKADRESLRYKEEQDIALGRKYSYNAVGASASLYEKFLDAIDILAEDATNEEAWAAINAYRQFQAERHER